MPSKRLPNAPLDSLRDARIAEVRERVRRLQRENAWSEGRMVQIDDVDRLMVHLISRVKSTLYFSLTAELPGKLAGLDAVEIRMRLRATADHILGTMAPIVEEFKWSQPPRLEDAVKPQGKATGRPRRTKT